MSNKTLIPALRAKVGDWQYYVCVMKYGQVAREFSFAFELAGGNSELQTLIQRGLSDRTKDIVRYLRENDHRFLGALIVAAWGGDPQFKPVEMQDSAGLLENIDESFGVLTFDGSQQYFALDGQHRLRAIKDAIKQTPDLGSEEVCVLIVSHYNTPEGRVRTRRLFTNINSNAKSTNKGENIALDEDDAFAIIARRLVQEHPFLSSDGRVDVITKDDPDGGGLKLAGSNVNKTSLRAWTTLPTLYDMLKDLSWKLSIEDRVRTTRPTDEELDDAYDALSGRIDLMLDTCGDLKTRLAKATSAREVRAPKGDEGSGHPFMRPAIQRAVVKTLNVLIHSDSISEKELLKRLKALPWKISEAPWTSIAVLHEDKVKMSVNNESRELLEGLLRCHLAPESKNAIKQHRKKYKLLRGSDYPVSELNLAKGITP